MVCGRHIVVLYLLRVSWCCCCAGVEMRDSGCSLQPSRLFISPRHRCTPALSPLSGCACWVHTFRKKEEWTETRQFAFHMNVCAAPLVTNWVTWPRWSSSAGYHSFFLSFRNFLCFLLYFWFYLRLFRLCFVLVQSVSVLICVINYTIFSVVQLDWIITISTYYFFMLTQYSSPSTSLSAVLWRRLPWQRNSFTQH